MSATSSGRDFTADRSWHLSSRLLDGHESDDAADEADDSSDPVAAPADTAVGPVQLAPLWLRIVTGRSFAWRIRAIRNKIRWARRRLARRMLTYLALHPTVRSSLKRGRYVAAIRAARRDRSGVSVQRGPGGPSYLVSLDASDPAAQLLAERFPRITRLDETGPAPFSESMTSAQLEALLDEVPAPIDVTSWNPVGYDPRRASGAGKVASVAGMSANDLRDRRLRALRLARRVRLGSADIAAAEFAPLVAMAAATGALLSDRVDAPLEAVVGTKLASTIRVTGPPSAAREREIRSLALRRAALGDCGDRGRLGQVLERGGSALSTEPHVSVLLASNRPGDVVDAARQVAAQVDVRCELVVGLHGAAMPAGLEASLAEAFAGDLVIARFPDDMVFGRVMAELTDRASAPLVSKWDDDDWYDAEHLSDLAMALDYSGAHLVGKAAEFVYLEHLDTTIRRFASRGESFSTTVAGGTLLARTADVRSVGWADVPRQVDRRLIEAMEAQGMACYRTHGFGYVLRRRSGGTAHTWKADDAYFLKQADEQRAGLDLDFAGFSGVRPVEVSP